MSRSNWGDMTIGELEKTLKILESLYTMVVPASSSHRPDDMYAFNWKLGRASVADEVRFAISAKKNRA